MRKRQIKTFKDSMRRGELASAESACQRFERRLAHDYFVRVHMSLILSAVVASGVLASKGLLDLGVHSLRLRYPIAVLTSYLVFLLLVRLWIWYVSLRSGALSRASGSKSSGWSGGVDIDGLGGSGGGGSGEGFGGFGGGSSGGGGASGSWDADTPPALVSEPAPAPVSSGSSGWFSKFDIDFDGDGWVVLVLLAALVLAIVGAGGYLVYAAPQILPEAAGQALLAGALTRVSKQDHHDWMSGVLRSTWMPFGIVLFFAAALGFAAHHYCPAAPRLIDVVRCALSKA